MNHSSILSLLLAAALVACAPFPGPDRPDGSVPVVTPERIRVASYNVRLFFDTVCDSGDCGGDAFEQAPSVGAFSARADEIADAITRLQADVVLLQEVESQASLDALASRLPAFRDAVLGETGAPGSLDVAVLSKWPIQGVNTHRSRILVRPDGTTTIFSREFLEVHLQAGDAWIVAFTSHFRSKNSDDPGRRLAEAETAAEIIAGVALERPEALVVFGGDLNDVPGSPPLEALETQARLRVAAELGDAAATYRYDGTGYAIDHIFHERAAGGGYVEGSAAVIRDGDYRGLGGSDHAALRADFSL